MEPSGRSAALWWLPAIVAGLLAAVMYRVGYDVEAGTRAGAEPGMSGLTFAFPFAVLAFCDLLWAIDGTTATDRRRRLVIARRMTVAAVVVTLLVVVWMWGSVSGGYAVSDALRLGGSVSAGLLLPLVPVWSSYRQCARLGA